MVDSATKKSDPQIKSKVLTVEKVKPDLRKVEKPLIDVKITNPVTYIKSWWKRIIGNEGIELKIKVRPLTAIAIAIIVLTVSLGIGKFNLPFKLPFFEYSVKEETFPPNIFNRATAFSGELQFDSSTRRYYLITSTSEAINLEVPDNIELSQFIGKRIFAIGRYHIDSRTLKVETASDMEILPTNSGVVPTSTPLPTPTPILTVTPSLSPTSFPSSTSRFRMWR